MGIGNPAVWLPRGAGSCRHAKTRCVVSDDLGPSGRGSECSFRCFLDWHAVFRLSIGHLANDFARQWDIKVVIDSIDEISDGWLVLEMLYFGRGKVHYQLRISLMLLAGITFSLRLPSRLEVFWFKAFDNNITASFYRIEKVTLLIIWHLNLVRQA